MGNTLNCCPGSRLVKVYGDNGRLLEFSDPVTALELMQEHPDHLVVYSLLNRRKGNGLGVNSTNHVRIRVCRPGEVLRIGEVYFLVHIPEQYTAKFAKYFKWKRSSNYSPSASPLSMCSSVPGSPLTVYNSPAASPLSTASPKRSSYYGTASSLSTASPKRSSYYGAASPLSTASPNRSFYYGTASPLSTYVPSPLSGSIRERTRAATKQPLPDSATSRRIRSPARLGSLNNSNHEVMRSIVNQHFQRDQIKPVPSPVRPGVRIQEKANKQFQRYSGRLVQSSGSPSSNSSSTKDTLGSIIQSRLEQSPGTPVLPSTRPIGTLGNIIRLNQEGRGSSPSQLDRSAGRSTHDTLRNILKQQQRRSPVQYPQQGGLSSKKSPRRSSKGGAGKVSRPRRGGSRPPHHRVALHRSPGRSVQSVAVNKDVNISWFFSRESPKMVESNAVAPPPVLGGHVRRRMLPRLMRARSVHCRGWTPALNSISENSPEAGFAGSMTREIPVRQPALQNI